MGMANNWRTTAYERGMVFPCDCRIKEYDSASTLYRGISIKAPPGAVFKWVSQLRIAPYSYDWIDNRGRSSPRRLIPDLPPLDSGQTIMGEFEIVAFEMDKSLTFRAKREALRKYQLQDLVASYLIYPADDQTSRLLVKCLMKYHGNPVAKCTQCLMPWLDLIMMRKQFLNLKLLSERKG